MTDNNSLFIKLLKQYTTIDHDFIDIFLKKFKINNELFFDIKDIEVANYLGIKLITLRKRLSNLLTNNSNYIEGVDFIKVKTNKTSGVTYWLNYQGFERIAMAGDTKEAGDVRTYFIKLREFITDNQKLIYQSLANKDEDLKKFVGYECVYFFAVDNKYLDGFKVGITQSNIVKRLKSYNTGRIKDVELKYLAIVKHSKLIENCIKLQLKDHILINRREIYIVDPKKLKETIVDCYCKNVSKKEHNDLYDELAELTGFYAFAKKNKNYTPMLIINKIGN